MSADGTDGADGTLSLAEAAQRDGVTPATLRRWAEDGVVPLDRGAWTPVVAAQARIVARLRERGHSLDAIRAASASGQLAFGYVEELLGRAAGDGDGAGITLAQAAAETGLDYYGREVNNGRR